MLRVFENLVLRKIFGPKRNYVTGEWRRVRHEELYDLYSTSDVIRMIKSKMMILVGHVASVMERRMRAVFWWVNLREMDYLEDIGVGRRIIFKWLFKKYSGDVN